MIKGIIDFLMDILETVVFIASIFLVFYLFIVQPNQVKGASMENTFHSGEYIFTSKVTYKFRDIKKGDVVIFKSPRNQDIELIKRVIALPGDTVVVHNGFVSVNDLTLNEPYARTETNAFGGGMVNDNVPLVVPEGEIFVLGDNRNASSDSREFGPIPQSTLIGQVFYRYFPFSKMGSIKNPVSFLPWYNAVKAA